MQWGRGAVSKPISEPVKFLPKVLFAHDWSMKSLWLATAQASNKTAVYSKYVVA